MKCCEQNMWNVKVFYCKRVEKIKKNHDSRINHEQTTQFAGQQPFKQ